ncbi:hypothetical protein OpiT1DRAFT_05332 [Opitutaceae bacterium TAV1]|nr:hypothetical protein OpiT1DRAFT_05332 [Opitutaceae bacterium TAV1]
MAATLLADPSPRSGSRAATRSQQEAGSSPFPLETWIVDLGLLTAGALGLEVFFGSGGSGRDCLRFVAGVLAVYSAGRAWRGENTGWWAALVFASTPFVCHGFRFDGALRVVWPMRIALMMPWIVFAPQAVCGLWRRRREGCARRSGLAGPALRHRVHLSSAWITASLLIAVWGSLLGSKGVLMVAIVPGVLTAAVALATGDYLVNAWRAREASGLRSGLVVFATAAIAALAWLFRSGPGQGANLGWLLFVAGGCLLILALLQASPRRGAHRVALVVMLAISVCLLRG